MIRPSRFLIVLIVLATAGLLWPQDAAAQRSRSASPRTGTAVQRPAGYYRPYSPRYYYPRYYYPRYYYPYYSSFYGPYYGGYWPYYSGLSLGFGFGYGWGPYGYPYSYPYPYGYYGWYDNTGSARLVMAPKHAQVYVDGYFVGLVDEFDGALQRLHVEIGEHELQVYLDGYRTFTQKILFTRGNTVKIEHALQPLAPGDPAEPKPAPAAGARASYPGTRQRPDPGYRPPDPGTRQEAQAEFGTLSLRVNPGDAEVIVDGEAWDRPEGENRFSIDLPEGPHQVEVRKDGFRPYMRTVEIRSGRTMTLNVSLSGQ